MITDEQKLLEPIRALREKIIESCENWEVKNIGSFFQFSKPFEEYKSGKAPQFAIEWNRVCEVLKFPPYQVGGKYRFIEVKPRREVNWNELKLLNLTEEQKEVIRELHQFSVKNSITSVALVLEDDRDYLAILKSIFELDKDRIVVKYVDNIFKAHLSILRIPIEKVAFNYGDIDDLL
jgi:hypothetical protein